MAVSQSDFERDRTLLVHLLHATIAEIKKGGVIGSAGEIRGLVWQITALELTERLGFRDALLLFLERQQPPHKIVPFLLWNNPRSGSGEINLSATRREDWERLVMVLSRWVLAVKGLPTPKRYPAEPIIVCPAGVEAHLWADPLWRTLYDFAAWLKSPSRIVVVAGQTATFELMAQKVHCLAEYEGLSHIIGRPPNATTADYLLFHPGDDNSVSVRLVNGEITEESIRSKVATQLNTWLDARAKGLAAACMDVLAELAGEAGPPAVAVSGALHGADGLPDESGYVRCPADSSEYVAATTILNKYSDDLSVTLTAKMLSALVEDYSKNRVRWTRPISEKTGKPHQQRRSVHLGDWIRYVNGFTSGSASAVGWDDDGADTLIKQLRSKTRGK